MRKRLYTLTTFALILAIFLSACNSTGSIICGHCSASNPKSNQYCANCGTAFFQSETQTSSDETQVTTPSASTEPYTNTIPQNTESAPTQPVPTQPAPTQPAPTQPPVTNAHTHSYKSATCTEPKTCSCGATSGNALGHNWSNATCTSPQKCSRCGTTNGSATGHTYTSKTTEPTCTAKGYTTHTCSSCGDIYKDNYKDASHNYQNYKCTSCFIVDKSHAYEYLMTWIKQEGTANGTHISISYPYGNDILALSYSATYDYLYISSSGYTDDLYAFNSLALDNFYYGVTVGSSEMCGYIDATTFTSNSPITYTRYTGPEAKKHEMAELARLSIDRLVDWLKWFLDAYNVGITVYDLGFTSY